MDDSQSMRRLDVNSTILLALASLALAWCSFQSTIWNGIQTFRLAEASLQSRMSQKNAVLVAHQKEIDATITIEFVSALIEKDSKRTSYYLARARPGMQELFNKWVDMDPLKNPAAPPHPLVMPQYRTIIDSLMIPSYKADQRADECWAGAQRANSISDKYILFTVVFSVSVFLGAICGKTRQVKTSRIILALGAAIYVVALVMILFMPVRWAD